MVSRGFVFVYVHNAGYDMSSVIKNLLTTVILFTFYPSLSWAITLSSMESQSRFLALDAGTRTRFSTATIDSFLNEGQRMAVLDAKPIIKPLTISLAVGSRYYTLPTDYLQVRRLTRDYLDLKEETPESLANKAGLSWETASAIPTNYFINFASRTMLGVYPYPSDSSQLGTIRLEYYAQATELVSGGDSPFNGIVELIPYHYILPYYAAYRMSTIDGRVDLAQIYRAEFYEGLERMKREALARPSYRPGLSPSIGTSRVGP